MTVTDPLGEWQLVGPSSSRGSARDMDAGSRRHGHPSSPRRPSAAVPIQAGPVGSASAACRARRRPGRGRRFARTRPSSWSESPAPARTDSTWLNSGSWPDSTGRSAIRRRRGSRRSSPARTASARRSSTRTVAPSPSATISAVRSARTLGDVIRASVENRIPWRNVARRSAWASPFGLSGRSGVVAIPRRRIAARRRGEGGTAGA